ncbi:agmatine deiminase family protein [Hymenobacter guriensis]|jgi:agmatine deiminase|uniref:Agmatine deiminase family protein n=1 Tax=Hymenobacter guriensis TaxID=2793065 RepID=A0ABS0L1M4_9BACT|nr:agmatine deiminase family protein [Hymenobacter guriensis]MBG8554020.1 agmatine deiminase family protein [Hymenobacter guriensis]
MRTVFVADTLPGAFPQAHSELAAALQAADYQVNYLAGTRDVWVRDFMPVPVPGGGWVQFRYAPSYLRTQRERLTITAARPLCSTLGIRARQSHLVVDGGNVVFVGSTAVLTDRVYSENPGVAAGEIRKRLQEELQAERLVIIPAHPDDFTGHADGMLQPVDDQTVLVSAYRNEKPAFTDLFRRTLAQAGLSSIALPYNPYGNRTYTDASGEYVNALQLPDLVLVPLFGQREDEAAMRTYEAAFAARRIVGVRVEDVARQGGALHCISWTAA